MSRSTTGGSDGASLRPGRGSAALAREPVRILRRLEWVAAVYGAAGALWIGVARRSLGSALVLTLAAAASIVAFRGLQGLVGQLAAGRTETRRPIDRRSRRLVWLRFSLLALAPLASLWMDSERAMSLLIGFSVLPLAIVTEGLLQLGWVLVERDHGR